MVNVWKKLGYFLFLHLVTLVGSFTLKMYILPSFGPHSNADARFGLGHSSFVQSSCNADVGCISAKCDKNFVSSSWTLHRSLWTI